MNVRERFEGREVRTVTLDPERAPYVRLAFELYASGEYSLQGLADELTDRGLRTRKGRYPEGSISDSKLSALCATATISARVSWDGVEHAGRHEPLVTPEFFDRVQAVLDASRIAGERRRSTCIT